MTDRSAFIVDFGGVVTRTLFETHDLTERALGLPPGTLDWRGPFAPDTDPLWQAMQADEISEREYWAARTRDVGRLVGEDWTEMSQLVKAARAADPAAIIRPEAVRAVGAAKARGAKLAILSNELDLFYGPEFRARLPLLSKFDAVVDATYTKILKPAPQAYLGCAQELGVEPSACVFVDDQERNVRGAERVGMAAVHFDVKRPAESFERALRLLADQFEEFDHA